MATGGVSASGYRHAQISCEPVPPPASNATVTMAVGPHDCLGCRITRVLFSGGFAGYAFAVGYSLPAGKQRLAAFVAAGALSCTAMQFAFT